MAQPCPEVREHIICDMNPKWFHYNNSILAVASGQSNTDATTGSISYDKGYQMTVKRY